MNNILINFKKTYFVFPRINTTSYRYSQFLYSFRKQALGLSVKTTSNYSVLVFYKFRHNFFDYFYYFSSISPYIKEFKNFKSWAGVFNSVFCSSTTISNFFCSFNFSNFFVYSVGGLNLFFFARVFGFYYYWFLEFFGNLKGLFL